MPAADGPSRDPGRRPHAIDRPLPTRPEGSSRATAYFIVLVLLAAVVFLPGLDTFGTYGWQEGQRLLVARQMQERLAAATGWQETADALLVPRTHGVVYLAKPPMIYWTQLFIAGVFGAWVDLVHLRLVVALAGMLGVLATFLAARELLRPSPDARGLDGVHLSPDWTDHAAAWGAAFLATGVLFVRSGRIGELDILLALFCILAIAGVARAWRFHRATGRPAWGPLAMAAASTACAALTKDPGVLIIALSAYGGVILHAVFAASARPLGAPARWCVLLAAVSGAAFAARTVQSPLDALGAAIIGGMCALVATIVLKLTDPAARRALWSGLKGTAPWVVLGAGVATSVAWRLAVSALIGQTEARALLSQEVDDNLRIFIAEAPVNNLKACLFGVGIGSGFAAFGAIWMLKERPRPSPGMAILLAWIVLNLCAFSLLGKGVQRYLTPVWPALAILGGMTMATLLTRYRQAVLIPRLATAGVILLALGQSWHYGYGREWLRPELSPRDFIAELAATPGIDLDRLVSYRFSNPAVSFYAKQRIESVGEDGVNSSMSGGRELSLDEFVASVQRNGPALALVRTRGRPDEARNPTTDLGELAAKGLTIEPVPMTSRFLEPSRVEIRCYRVR